MPAPRMRFSLRSLRAIVASAALVAVLVSTVSLGAATAFAGKPSPSPTTTPTPTAGITSVTLTIDKAQIVAGDSATLIATVNADLTAAKATLTIVDQTTRRTLKSCTTGTACAVATTFASGPAHTYVAKVLTLVSAPVTLTRAPWNIILTSDRSTFLPGEEVTLTATANQDVGYTGGNYQIYIFDNTSGALLTTCAGGSTCLKTVTNLFTTGPAHQIVAVVAKPGVTSFSRLADIQATSNIVSIARQTWFVTLTSNKSTFLPGDSVTFSAAVNQELSGSGFAVHVFDKTAGTRVGSCTTGTTCSIAAGEPFTSGDPHTYVAIVGAGGSPANLTSVLNVQATSNEVILARSTWTLSLTSARRNYTGQLGAPTTANTEFQNGEGALLEVTTNRPVDGNYQIYMFDVTSGRALTSCQQLNSCNSQIGYKCVVGTHCFADVDSAWWAKSFGCRNPQFSYTNPFCFGGPRSYIAVVGAPGGTPKTPAEVIDIQGMSNPVTLSRTPWTVRLVTQPHVIKRYPYADTVSTTEVEIRAATNQGTGGYYCAYVVDMTTNVTLNPICGDYPNTAFRTIPANDGHVYQAFVADLTSSTWPFNDIQAISGGFMALGGELLSTKSVGGGLSDAAKYCQCYEVDPVNTSTGEFYLGSTDLSVAGVGPALTLSRTYSAVNTAYDGPFGYGWSTNIDMRLSVLVAGTAADPLPQRVEVTQENGSSVPFGKAGAAGYVTGPGILAALTYDATTQRWRFTRNSSTTFVFDVTGALLSIEDRNGNTVTLARDASGHVTSLSASGGRSLTLTWAGSHVVQVADSAGRAVDYAYASGDLTSATAVDGRVSSYAYDPAHYMTSLTKPGGGVTTNSYDSSHRVVSQSDPLGRVTTFLYQTGIATNPTALTTITAPDGSTTMDIYVGGRLSARLTAAKTSSEATTGYVYDLAGNLTSTTDAMGGVTASTYDSAGNKLSQVDPLGRITVWTYNDMREATSVTDALGRTTTMTYDADGNLVGSRNPNDRVTTWTYNPNGTVATSTDAQGKTTQFGHDAAGQLISNTDADGRMTSMTLNAAGVAIAQTNGAGKTTAATVDASGRVLTAVDALGHTTQIAYDAAGNSTAITDASGQTTSYVYDAAGQLTSTTNALGKVSRFTYTPTGLLATVTNANNRTTTNAYDALGRAVSTTDPKGRITRFTYDLLGRKLSTTLPSGASSSLTYDAADQVTSATNAKGELTAFTYNLNGQLLTVVDPLGRTTSNAYNTDGLLSTRTLPDGSTERYAYDAVGQETAFINADGKVTTYVYSNAGRVTSKTEPGGLLTSYAYDAAGRPSVQTLPDGTTLTPTYDDASQLVRLHYSTPGASDTTYAYDALGRPVTMTDASGTSSFAYDAIGQLTSESNGAGASTGYGYDNVGQMTSISYPGARTVNYAYDEAGQLASLTDWSGKTTTFGWTVDGQLANQTDPNGVSQTNSYDAAGRLTSLATSTSQDTLAAFGYTYDAAGQIASAQTTVGGNAVDTAYAYDPLSQLASVTATPSGGAPSTSAVAASSAGLLTTTPRGATLSYGTAQQVTDMVPAVGPVVTFGYDSRGSRTSSTVAATQSEPSTTTLYTFTPSGALASVTTPTSSVTYTSDARGLRQSRAVGGATDQFTWSSVGGLPLLLDDGDHSYVYGPSSTPIAQVDDSTGAVEYLHADLLGTPRLLTDATGAAVGSVSFDAFGNRATYTGAQSAFGFTGNWTDPDTGLLYLRARDYDPATGQFLSVDPAVDATRQPYAYAGNNPISRTDPTGLDPWTDLNESFNPVLGGINGVSNLGKHLGNGCDIGVIAGDYLDIQFAQIGLALTVIPGAGLLSAGVKALLKDGINAFLKTTVQGLLGGAERSAARTVAADGITMTARLQAHVEQAVADYASGLISMTTRQARAAARNPALESAFRGQVIDDAVKKAVIDDPSIDLWVSRPGEFGPDFHDIETNAWWDITTPGQWQRHVDLYTNPFGTGIGLFTQ